MTRIYLKEKFEGESSFNIQIYLRTYGIWARQRKVPMKIESDDKGAYVEFTNEEDAILFKLTVWQFTTRNAKIVFL